eukprot:Cvel_15821.t1-p1 / transcript=Cvel_15821.t1 / gene=Cvel_15821 / organism=Chromera_velia_CCMP2878 / gene_product=hypothetical protein / transcript_product=hypothetical protein / location=Cvel_scaffold1188:39698-53876(+) / protein_length=1552 / sequence_SO=supercontig / SO=protein_coding / is_pseudo=false
MRILQSTLPFVFIAKASGLRKAERVPKNYFRCGVDDCRPQPAAAASPISFIELEQSPRPPVPSPFPEEDLPMSVSLLQMSFLELHKLSQTEAEDLLAQATDEFVDGMAKLAEKVEQQSKDAKDPKETAKITSPDDVIKTITGIRKQANDMAHLQKKVALVHQKAGPLSDTFFEKTSEAADKASAEEDHEKLEDAETKIDAAKRSTLEHLKVTDRAKYADRFDAVSRSSAASAEEVMEEAQKLTEEDFPGIPSSQLKTNLGERELTNEEMRAEEEEEDKPEPEPSGGKGAKSPSSSSDSLSRQFVDSEIDTCAESEDGDPSSTVSELSLVEETAKSKKGMTTLDDYGRVEICASASEVDCRPCDALLQRESMTKTEEELHVIWRNCVTSQIAAVQAKKHKAKVRKEAQKVVDDLKEGEYEKWTKMWERRLLAHDVFQAAAAVYNLASGRWTENPSWPLQIFSENRYEGVGSRFEVAFTQHADAYKEEMIRYASTEGEAAAMDFAAENGIIDDIAAGQELVGDGQGLAGDAEQIAENAQAMQPEAEQLMADMQVTVEKARVLQADITETSNELKAEIQKCNDALAAAPATFLQESETTKQTQQDHSFGGWTPPTSPPDTGAPDTGAPDTGAPDTGIDTGIDTGVPGAPVIDPGVGVGMGDCDTERIKELTDELREKQEDFQELQAEIQEYQDRASELASQVQEELVAPAEELMEEGTALKERGAEYANEMIDKYTDTEMLQKLLNAAAAYVKDVAGHAVEQFGLAMESLMIALQLCKESHKMECCMNEVMAWNELATSKKVPDLDTFMKATDQRLEKSSDETWRDWLASSKLTKWMSTESQCIAWTASMYFDVPSSSKGLTAEGDLMGSRTEEALAQQDKAIYKQLTSIGEDVKDAEKKKKDKEEIDWIDRVDEGPQDWIPNNPKGLWLKYEDSTKETTFFTLEREGTLGFTTHHRFLSASNDHKKMRCFAFQKKSYDPKTREGMRKNFDVIQTLVKTLKGDGPRQYEVQLKIPTQDINYEKGYIFKKYTLSKNASYMKLKLVDRSELSGLDCGDGVTLNPNDEKTKACLPFDQGRLNPNDPKFPIDDVRICVVANLLCRSACGLFPNEKAKCDQLYDPKKPFNVMEVVERKGRSGMAEKGKKFEIFLEQYCAASSSDLYQESRWNKIRDRNGVGKGGSRSKSPPGEVRVRKGFLQLTESAKGNHKVRVPLKPAPKKRTPGSPSSPAPFSSPTKLSDAPKFEPKKDRPPPPKTRPRPSSSRGSSGQPRTGRAPAPVPKKKDRAEPEAEDALLEEQSLVSSSPRRAWYFALTKKLPSEVLQPLAHRFCATQMIPRWRCGPEECAICGQVASFMAGADSDGAWNMCKAYRTMAVTEGGKEGETDDAANPTMLTNAEKTRNFSRAAKCKAIHTHMTSRNADTRLEKRKMMPREICEDNHFCALTSYWHTPEMDLNGVIRPFDKLREVKEKTAEAKKNAVGAEKDTEEREVRETPKQQAEREAKTMCRFCIEYSFRAFGKPLGSGRIPKTESKVQSAKLSVMYSMCGNVPKFYVVQKL